MRRVLRVLGPLELHVDGQTVGLGSPRQRAVLGVLAVNVGRPVSADRLLDAIWGENLPSSGAAQVHTYVHRLRKGCGSWIGLRRTESGYVLEQDSVTVDLFRFGAELACARAARDNGDWSGAAELFARALNWWRGRPFDGLTGGYLDAQRRELQARYADARHDWAECALRLGRHGEVLDRLAEMINDDPVQERLYALRMLALYRSGRVADALATYDQVRCALRTELGLDPGPELRALHQRILRRDPALVDQGVGGPIAEQDSRRSIAVGYQ